MNEPRGRIEEGVVRVAGDARQRYYDARGYGRPIEGNEIALAPVEAAHLLFRGDLRVEDMDFPAFVRRFEDPTFLVRYLVYADLRERGFYLSPAREGWVSDPPADAHFVVYERGSGPWDDERLYELRVAGEREAIGVADLPGALAVVDEESEVTYFEVERPTMNGSSTGFSGTVEADLLADRAIAWDPPEGLFSAAFYGQPLSGRQGADGPIQLSLLEAAYLAERGSLSTDGSILERGRAVEGERFERRLAVYTALRERGVVPKTGFKFGADFRVYADVTSVDDLGHSESLVRALPPGCARSPRELSLDVRLAHGVRKRMVFALASANDGTKPTFVSVGRLTP
ncbi:tRNA-intron lyase [Halalkalicoccus jeotgali]|uniref:tRNA-splicing endonuclease n=1 Tax=Halalkalicoccus jeotgali (strain DSM 18796 / CECT 7217 / JCM 14584 / KCTC 4019 / B3) TaxID=795797 RepID=D8J3S0_HALJB|nr:tRNA-intron lyase [Halalkalicoccus jeotgali]ADJ13411.1 tRNA intron endonuclease [Halalkalicoccus jeotgali B3]ELY32757.1 tRNA splicing endonuclease [Halalkalicoccus jeotgali B3]